MVPCQPGKQIYSFLAVDELLKHPSKPGYFPDTSGMDDLRDYVFMIMTCFILHHRQ